MMIQKPEDLQKCSRLYLTQYHEWTSYQLTNLNVDHFANVSTKSIDNHFKIFVGTFPNFESKHTFLNTPDWLPTKWYNPIVAVVQVLLGGGWFQPI